jgi:hypothetical protein
VSDRDEVIEAMAKARVHQLRLPWNEVPEVLRETYRDAQRVALDAALALRDDDELPLLTARDQWERIVSPGDWSSVRWFRFVGKDQT